MTDLNKRHKKYITAVYKYSQTLALRTTRHNGHPDKTDSN